MTDKSASEDSTSEDSTSEESTPVVVESNMSASNSPPQPSSLVYNDLAGIKPPTFSWHDDDLGNSFKKFRRYCDLMLSTPT